MHSTLYNCCVCFSEFDRIDHIPKLITSCGHTVCSFCLEKILTTQPEPKCPLDRKVIPPQYRTCKLLPTNLVLLQLLDAKQKAENEVCSSHKAPASLVCITDKCKICSYCANYGSHRGHVVKEVGEIKREAAAKKEVLESGINEYDAYQPATSRLLEEKKSSLVEANREKFQRMRDVLDKKEQKILSDIAFFFAKERLKISSHVQKKLKLEQSGSKIIRGLVNTNNTPQQPASTLLVTKTGLATPNGSEVSEEAVVGELKDIFGKALDSLEKPLVRLIDELKDASLFPLPKHVKTEEEKLKYKISVIREVLRIEKRNGHLIISPADCTKKENQTMFVDSTKWKDVNKVSLDFRRKELTEESVQAMFYVWDGLKGITSLNIAFSNENLKNKDFSTFCNHGFWATEALQEIEIDLEGCDIGDEDIVCMVNEVLMRTVNVRSLTLGLNKTKVTDTSIQVFSEKVLPLMKDLKSLALFLSNTSITDEGMSSLWRKLRDIKELVICLGNTGITDKTIEVLSKYAIPVMGSLQGLELWLNNTRITDVSLEEFFIAMADRACNLKSLSLNFNNTIITDWSIRAFSYHTLPLLTSLNEKFELHLNGIGLTDYGFQPLVMSLQSCLRSIQNFSLSLNNTYVSSESVSLFNKSVLPNMNNLRHFSITLNGTKVSSNAIGELFMNLKPQSDKMRSLTLDFGLIEVTDEILNKFTEHFLPVMSNITNFSFGLGGTKVTDEAVVPFCEANKKYLRNLVTYELVLTSTQITDRSGEAISRFFGSCRTTPKRTRVTFRNTQISEHMANLLNYIVKK